ncbi:hypothetical protein DFH07DRAFT_1037137 [Mycena maculata]|uniref:Uncharacterized protein n=1 Tax=Mycena maculata TaxID=230809 RepID=A0AAD7IQH1_9AGAR|nr:hypothetical protein DFH07DRAFT_1037137 [Mycena maculata]
MSGNFCMRGKHENPQKTGRSVLPLHQGCCSKGLRLGSRVGSAKDGKFTVKNSMTQLCILRDSNPEFLTTTGVCYRYTKDAATAVNLHTMDKHEFHKKMDSSKECATTTPNIANEGVYRGRAHEILRDAAKVGFTPSESLDRAFWRWEELNENQKKKCKTNKRMEGVLGESNHGCPGNSKGRLGDCVTTTLRTQYAVVGFTNPDDTREIGGMGSQNQKLEMGAGMCIPGPCLHLSGECERDTKDARVWRWEELNENQKKGIP